MILTHDSERGYENLPKRNDVSKTIEEMVRMRERCVRWEETIPQQHRICPPPLSLLFQYKLLKIVKWRRTNTVLYELLNNSKVAEDKCLRGSNTTELKN